MRRDLFELFGFPLMVLLLLLCPIVITWQVNYPPLHAWRVFYISFASLYGVLIVVSLIWGKKILPVIEGWFDLLYSGDKLRARREDRRWYKELSKIRDERWSVSEKSDYSFTGHGILYSFSATTSEGKGVTVWKQCTTYKDIGTDMPSPFFRELLNIGDYRRSSRDCILVSCLYSKLVRRHRKNKLPMANPVGT